MRHVALDKLSCDETVCPEGSRADSAFVLCRRPGRAPRYPYPLARIFLFGPYRFRCKAGSPENLFTQPYDKISPEMQARYLSLSPYNLVRLILGERFSTDTGADNEYTRAAGLLRGWVGAGVL